MSKNVKGVLGEKLGMTQVWDENNKIVPVTVVKAGPCVVTQVRSADNDGYAAVQLGFGAIDPRKVNQPTAGHYAKSGATPRRHLVELRTDDASEYTLGQELGPDVFEPGQRVDVSGTSKGKGFAGVMKRHNFHGVWASHGAKAQPPQARLDRRRLHAKPRLQGPEHGWSHGWRHRDRPEPDRALGRHRAGPAADQGSYPRPQRHSRLC